VNLRRPAALLALTVLAGALVFATGTAAFAATSSITIGAYTYDYDDAAVGAGATITGYDATTGGLTPTIPDTVTIGGTDYSVTVVGFNSFAAKGLTSVTIPASVTSVGDDAFNNIPLLTSVTFLGAAPTIFGEQGLGASFGSGSGLTLYYNWAFDVARAAGGFTAPTWQGYNTVEQATVAFSMGGRGTAPATQMVTVGASASEPADPTSTGALFTGWYTDAALTSRPDFADPVTSNFTLYAGWAALADTGADITPLMVVVPGLRVVVGLGMVLLSRRKKSNTSE
jgi:uncharacterized repeat protein (TIGR02543 family)